MTATDTEIVVDRDGAVGTVTINRPGVLNAIREDMWPVLRVAFTELAYDPSIRVVVVTGNGDGFCSGADVSRRSGGEPGMVLHPHEVMKSVAEACMALYDLPKPTIARVNGVATGAGANLALMCDLVIASDRARFCEIFARRGLSVDFGGSWILPRLVGLHKAKELAFLTPMLSAAEALEVGLVNRVVAHDELDAAVDEWTAKLVAGPPRALALSKELLNNSFEQSIYEAVADEGRAQAINLRSRDAAEAGAAFVEKRAAEFTGW